MTTFSEINNESDYGNFSDDDTQSTFSQIEPTLFKVKNSSKKKKLPQYLKFAMDPINPKICINAVTGHKYYDPKTNKPIYNNSLASTQLYIVMDTTSPIGNKDPFKLFYDTPEQYERHRKLRISRDMKESWRSRMTKNGYSPFGIGNSMSLTDATQKDKKPMVLSDNILAHT